MKNQFLYVFFIFLLLLTTCGKRSENQSSTDAADKIPFTVYGILPDGRQVNQYALTNKNKLEVRVINYGGIITAIKTPDKNGLLEDIVLGYDSLSGYLKETPYFGALVGRFANRIAKGKFTLDGKEYTLAQNSNGEHLHGGVKGFDKVFWDIEQAPAQEGTAIKLTYASPDGEEGYPGNLRMEVTYTLTDKNELRIDYTATTDKKTVVNLSQHTYFNLTGNSKRDILDHQLELNADKYLPVTKTLIPTGELRSVDGTPFDFTKREIIGARVNNTDQQLLYGLGYDHCWVLSSIDSMKRAALLYEPISGRQLEVFTTQPAIQFYSGNFLDGTLIGKGRVKYNHRYGLCLETQHFPDSPNQKEFPSVELAPQEVYKTVTIYRFSNR
jgi:aldose 1-epimerase